MRQSMRRAVVAAAAVGMVATTAGTGLAQSVPVGDRFPQATFAEQDATVERVTAAVHMTKEELSPTRGFTGPSSMLASPDNPRVLVAAVADLRSRVCSLTRSTDAGATWQILDAKPGPRDYPYCTSSNAGVPQAVIAFGRDNTLYYALLGYGENEGGRQGKVSLIVARSNDLGDTWATTIVDNNRGNVQAGPAPDRTVAPDAVQPSASPGAAGPPAASAPGAQSPAQSAPSASGVTTMAVDTSGDRDVVHVGFSHRYFPSPPEGSPLNDNPVLVATSTDGGETFGKPVNINESIDLTQNIGGKDYGLLMSTSFGRPFMTAHEGVLLAVADSRTPADQRVPGESYPALPMLVGRSTDQGQTWTVTKLGPPVFTGAGAMTGMGWTAEGGDSGTFVLAYAATPETSETSGIEDIVVQRSTDNGQTWTAPVAIDDDRPEQNATSFYPQLSVAPNGRVDVVWQDNRGLADFRFHTRYTYSTDGGATWAENVQVTDQPINFNIGISFNSDIRTPPGVASTNEYAVIGWADPRFGDETSQTQDAFVSMTQFEALPAQNTLLPKLAAVFGGLLLAGIVLGIVLLRRRQGGAPPASPVERSESVGSPS